MTEWEQDKQETDPYLPMVKAICAAYILHEAPLEEDRDHNTDLMVLVADGLRIAVRLRRPWYYKEPRYQGEFTIRDTRPSGNATEWEKILDGFGDYFFYGFRTEKPPHLWAFGLLDLRVFRTWVIAFFQQWGKYPGRGGIPNPDGSSTFRAIEWQLVPLDAILTMYPKKIAVGNTLMTPEIQESIQLALELTLPGYEREQPL
jgi:hypothetical protein